MSNTTKGEYTLVVCEVCGINRYIQAKQYPEGIPTKCIRCEKAEFRY